MDFEQACEDVLAFRDERNWRQFHNPKDLAISINLEAAELLELFQWSGADVERADMLPQMEEELADVLIYCIDLADRLRLEINAHTLGLENPHLGFCERFRKICALIGSGDSRQAPAAPCLTLSHVVSSSAS